MKRHITIEIDAEAETCGACSYLGQQPTAHSRACFAFGRWLSRLDGDAIKPWRRCDACLAAEAKAPREGGG